MSEPASVGGVSWTLAAGVGDFVSTGFADVRAGHGVVALHDASGGCVRVVASADCRTWLRDRLGNRDASKVDAGSASATGLDDRGRPEVDLRPIVSGVSLYECGSMLEADLVWASVARELTPDAAAEASGRARVWCVVASRRDGGRSDGPLRLVARAWPAGLERGDVEGEAIGPFASKAAAERFAAAAGMISGVSLSPSMLTDPSEIENHEAAVGRAFKLDDVAVRAVREEAFEAMRAASDAMAYEDAAAKKQLVDLIESVIDEPGGWSVGRLAADGAGFGWLGLMPGVGAKRVRPIVVTGLGWAGLGERSIEELEPTLVFEADAGVGAMNDARLEQDVLVMDAAVRAMRRGRVGWFRLGAGEVVRGGELMEAAELAAERSRG